MKVSFEHSFYQDVRKIRDAGIKSQIRQFIDTVENISSIRELPGIKKLKGHPQAYRKRIGDFRIGFFLEKETIIMSRCLDRNSIYTHFP